MSTAPKCPRCGQDLVGDYKRVVLLQPLVKWQRVPERLTRMRQVYRCDRCNKFFQVSVGLFEVEVVPETQT